MTERKELERQVEKVDNGWKKLWLAGSILAAALSLGLASEWTAQEFINYLGRRN